MTDITKKKLYITKIKRAVRSHLTRRLIPMDKPRVDDCFAYTLAGICRYCMQDGTVFTVQPGDVLYLGKGWDYSLEVTSEEYHYMICNFAFLTQQQCAYRLLRPTNPVAFEMLFSRLIKAFAVSSPERVPASMAQLYNIYALFIRCTQREYVPGSARARIEETRIFIQENITQPQLSVEALAQRADMSQVYFRKLFSSVYSVPPSKYILQQRVAHACRLMEMEELRLEDIALESGFSSLPHMCKVFKSIVGNTPAQYRKKLLQQ